MTLNILTGIAFGFGSLGMRFIVYERDYFSILLGGGIGVVLESQMLALELSRIVLLSSRQNRTQLSPRTRQSPAQIGAKFRSVGYD